MGELTKEPLMKKTVLLTLLAGAACAATAQEQGRVLSSTPIVQQVAIPRQVCGTDTVYAGAPNSGAGAVMGAIAGGPSATPSEVAAAAPQPLRWA